MAVSARERSLRRQRTKHVQDRRVDLGREISLHTDWASLLGVAPKSVVKKQIGDNEVWLVENLLSVEECTAIIDSSEAHGFGPTDFVKSYRGNLRLTVTDLGLADVVWQRLKDVVPARVTLKAPAELTAESWWSHYPDVDGAWKAVGLNECWRLAKYYPGDQFMCHCDGAFEKSAGSEMSMLTANIYLNSGFEGGKTRFYFNDDPYLEWREDFGQPDFEITPTAGLCLLFRQPPGQTYWHDGEAVRAGQKYLLRSDVMYRRQPQKRKRELRHAQ